MKKSIRQTLESAVTAHKEHKLKKAEQLYRAILRVRPNHPDANHNLGLLAVAAGNIANALPLFKKALEANPSVDQFWLSYIEGLIQASGQDDVKRALANAKQAGVSEEQLALLEQKLQSNLQDTPDLKTKSFAVPDRHREQFKNEHSKKSASGKNEPSQQQLENLLEHYVAARFTEAEKLATTLTHDFPTHPFGWKVLGASIRQNGKLRESLMPMRRSIELSPKDADAHNNLGVTLQSLGMLEKAEVSYQQAIALQPDYAEAHDNLAATLRALGKLDEAERRIKTVIELRPDYAEAHSNLGNTLQQLGKLNEAEASYRQAIIIKPDYADAHINLGTVLQQLDRSAEAVKSYSTAITLKPTSVEAHYNRGTALQERGRFDEAEASYRKAIALKPDFIEASNHLLRCLFTLNKRSGFLDQLNQVISTDETNAVIGSLACRAELKYGIKVNNSFCTDPLGHCSHIDLKTQCHFEQVFVRPVISLLEGQKFTDRSQTLLINGKQTSGNLFSLQNASIDRIEATIRTEIEKYRLKFKDSSEGFVTRWPSEYTLKGWLIRMNSGGRLKPHIHETGWLSGSVYIHVPSKLEPGSGNLKISVGEDSDVVGAHQNKQATINVKTGSLVLFPSSTTHHTSPFHSEEQRIVLAFDAVGK